MQLVAAPDFNPEYRKGNSTMALPVISPQILHLAAGNYFLSADNAYLQYLGLNGDDSHNGKYNYFPHILRSFHRWL